MKHYLQITLALSLTATLTVFPLLNRPTALAGQTFPQTRGAGGSFTAGGKKGGSCPPMNLPLVALAYAYQDNDNGLNIYGQTTQETPTLWFYMPYGKNDDLKDKVKFALREEGETQPVETLTLPELPAKPGFISIKTPKLDKGKKYLWSLTIHCGKGINVAGWIERVEPKVALKITPNQSNLEKADLYKQQGIWYDMVSSLLDQQPPAAKKIPPNWQTFFLESWKDVMVGKNKTDDFKTLLNQEVVNN